MACGSHNLLDLNVAGNKRPIPIVDHLRAEWGFKLVLLVVLVPCVFLPYHFLQGHHYFPAYTMPLSFLDKGISFSGTAVWLYFSLYLLMLVGPVLMNNRKQLRQFGIGIILVSLCADVIFIFWPTLGPRPVTPATNGMYRTLVAIDNPFHAFPSLHAAFAIYSALCGGLVLRQIGGCGLWQFLLWLWAFAILYATLATKQHVAADIIAGGALGFVMYRACLSPSQRLPCGGGL